MRLSAAMTALMLAVAVGSSPTSADSATDLPPSVIAAWQTDVRPLLTKYCQDCHAGEEAEAEVDLAAIQTIAQVQSQLPIWLRVREMLDSRQMPPKDADPPTDEERNRLRLWVHDYLKAEAVSRAGDPGSVLLRRLSNAEYTYTVQDLTGLADLDPAREFPVDGAAGEGFTNTGSGLVMSPSLVTKYLDAAKEIADHAVLLPHGIRFSPQVTERDRTDAYLARIQAFYRRYTEDGGGMTVNLDGHPFTTNQGGRLPVDRYLSATLAERDALRSGTKSLADVAAERDLSLKYLGGLWDVLTNDAEQPSPLLAEFRGRWESASIDDASVLTAQINQWQERLWKFNSIGHIGREGGPTAWMEPVSPIAVRQEFRVPLPEPSADGSVSVYLATCDLGDGREGDIVLWERARIEFPVDEGQASRPPVLLRDVRRLARQIPATMSAELARTAEYLSAVVDVHARQSSAPDAAGNAASIAGVAAVRQLNPLLLKAWADYTGLGVHVKPEVTGHFTRKLVRSGGYEPVNGWMPDKEGLPSVVTNRADEDISIATYVVPARGVTLHPLPNEDAIVAWQAPVGGAFHTAGRVIDRDDKCGNGAAWRVEHQSTSGKAVLAEGTIDNGGEASFEVEAFTVEEGDVVRLMVAARDADHVCDTTQVQWQLIETSGQKREWDLAAEIVDRIHDGNPLADSFGHANVWHFCGSGESTAPHPAIPPGSALAVWRELAIDGEADRSKLAQSAAAVRQVAVSKSPERLAVPDEALLDQLRNWHGPLRWTVAALSETAPTHTTAGSEADSFGLDPVTFGVHPDGGAVEETSLCIQAPSIIKVKLPAKLVAGGVFAASASLYPPDAPQGSVQVQVTTADPEPLRVVPTQPIITAEEGPARQRWEAALEDFRELFPPALCYARIVPVDEVVTLTLFHREDDQLQKLMLTDAETAELDRQWDEFRFVSREPLKLVVAFEQISEFATQDRPDLVIAFAPMKQRINDRADEFRRQLVQIEPVHLAAVLDFADRAWRRRLTESEQQNLRDLYHHLRETELPHEESIRLTLARVLTSPSFLYRREQPPTGEEPAPVANEELASRLSYFLWSSLPDEELRQTADAGVLTSEEELLHQTQRMLHDQRIRRLAVHFACQWLHVRDFDQNDDKNEALYPEFAEVRDDMYEETVRFFEDMFAGDGSILDLLNADHTFLNETLAKHYGIEGVSGDDWRRVDGLQARGRGGVLGMATVLASQSGASRTSPILRGNWVYETLLGERLPRPPANVPQLPEAVPTGLTARELIEQHSSVPECAKCHAHIDPYGFALEQFDAIGRTRPDAVDTKTTLIDGTEIDGLDGLRRYLAGERRDDVVHQFCRKLLGFALGREIGLSDEVLLDEMQRKLEESGFRFSVAVQTIVTSPQFREIRGREMTDE